MGVATLCGPVRAIKRRHGVRVGVVTSVGSANKTFMGKTADGAEHIFVFLEHAAVHGAKRRWPGNRRCFVADWERAAREWSASPRQRIRYSEGLHRFVSVIRMKRSCLAS